MSLDSSVVVSRSFSRTDYLLKALLQAKYVKELWIFFGGVLALLACGRAVRVLVELLTKPELSGGSMQAKPDPENNGASHVGTGRISVRRLPAAISSVFKVVAFRWTIPIGPRAVASFSELVFILGYMTAILIWLLVDSMWLDLLIFYAFMPWQPEI